VLQYEAMAAYREYKRKTPFILDLRCVVSFRIQSLSPSSKAKGSLLPNGQNAGPFVRLTILFTKLISNKYVHANGPHERLLALALCLSQKVEDQPFSAPRYCLYNIVISATRLHPQPEKVPCRSDKGLIIRSEFLCTMSPF
jgi:hypothetical protein